MIAKALHYKAQGYGRSRCRWRTPTLRGDVDNVRRLRDALARHDIMIRRQSGWRPMSR